MLLAADVGNSNIILGLFEGKEFLSSWRVSTDIDKTSDEYALLFSQLLKFDEINTDKIEDILIASVVPPLRYSLETSLYKVLNKKCLFAGEDIPFDLKFDLDLPIEKVGADRLVNVMSAMDKYELPFIIVDIGTAITVDYVSKEGVYSGGMIAPGLKISAEALFKETAQLPNVELLRPEKAMAKDTVSAIQSGLIYGFMGLINGLIERIIDEENLSRDNLNCIYTGGFSQLLVEEGKNNIINRNLTMDGLRIMYEKYKA